MAFNSVRVWSVAEFDRLGAGGRPAAKPFAAALLRIVEKKLANDPEGRVLLDGIAQQLVAKATKGDLASIRELADRIEGTPARSVTLGGEGGGAIPFVNVSPAENERRWTGRNFTTGRDVSIFFTGIGLGRGLRYCSLGCVHRALLCLLFEK
jgi:hypothetical protein